MDKKLSLIIAGAITISVTVYLVGTYLLDSNKYSIRDFKVSHQNTENF